MTESGCEDFVFDTYTALTAPARAPPEAAAKGGASAPFAIEVIDIT